jgi:hypothetical protein
MKQESLVEEYLDVLERLRRLANGAQLPLDKDIPLIPDQLPLLPVPLAMSEDACTDVYTLLQENYDQEEIVHWKYFTEGPEYLEDKLYFFRAWVMRWMARIYVLLWEIVRTRDADGLTDGIPADLMTKVRYLTFIGRTMAADDLEWFGEEIGLSADEIEYLKVVKDRQLEEEENQDTLSLDECLRMAGLDEDDSLDDTKADDDK